MQTKLKIYEDEPVKESATKRTYNRKPKTAEEIKAEYVKMMNRLTGRKDCKPNPHKIPVFKEDLVNMSKPGEIKKIYLLKKV